MLKYDELCVIIVREPPIEVAVGILTYILLWKGGLHLFITLDNLLQYTLVLLTLASLIIKINKK